MCEVLLDVDVVIKLAAYGLLTAIAHPGCGPNCPGTDGVIATTRFVARSRLQRAASDAAAAISRLDKYLGAAAVVEPTEPELRLAADLESASANAGVDLDVGESQLCAIAVLRGVPALLTGDKRAIASAEALIGVVPQLGALAQRIACLEQAMTLAVERLGAHVVRAQVLAEFNIDKAVSICFQTSDLCVPDTFLPTGLSSYIRSVRSTAPTLLMAGETLSLPSVA